MERPKVTQEMIAQAAKKLAAENGWDAEQADELAKAYRYPMDGYELAKELDSRYYWPITVMDVDALDCMDSDVRGLLKAACLVFSGRLSDWRCRRPCPAPSLYGAGDVMRVRHTTSCRRCCVPPCGMRHAAHARMRTAEVWAFRRDLGRRGGAAEALRNTNRVHLD